MPVPDTGAPRAEALVVADRLAFAYPGGRRPVWQNLSFAVEEGETVLLLGPSGSGKSTLALCLGGLIPQVVEGEMDGTVRIAGMDTREADMGELVPKVGTVFQDADSQAIMTMVEDEVAFGLENMGVAPGDMRARVEAALRAAGLQGLESAPVERLSGGQKQRLSLACVLAMEPRLLVLDEPTANLDPEGTEELYAALRELKRSGNRTIVLIEHKLDEWVDALDRVIVIGPGGAIALDGSPEAVFYDEADKLEEWGVWVPQTVELARKLEAAGLSVPGRPLSVPELAGALSRSAWTFPDAGEVRASSAPEERECRRLPPSAPEERELRRLAPSASPPPRRTPLLEIRPAVGAGVGGRGGWLQPMSLQVYEGQFWVVVGRNGSGKTTLARHMMGLAPSHPGTVLIRGKEIASYSPGELASLIGYVFQNPEHQFVTERVADEIAFGLRGLGLPAADVSARTETLLSRFGLSAWADMHPFQLSHGQKRRLSVASVMALEQPLLILDEPTFGQDRRNSLQLMGMLKELQQEGRTIIAITHDMKLAVEYADHVAVMSGGALLQTGPVDRLFADEERLFAAGLRLPPAARLGGMLAERLPGASIPRELSPDGWVRRWKERVAEAGPAGAGANV